MLQNDPFTPNRFLRRFLNSPSLISSHPGTEVSIWSSESHLKNNLVCPIAFLTFPKPETLEIVLKEEHPSIKNLPMSVTFSKETKSTISKDRQFPKKYAPILSTFVKIERSTEPKL
eukprot:TRINITY_DN2547_c1_g4_i1.p2 TRINITY_DN2547_c1_g4~~TRINITY_DN2547_c1_g4_i1.p2  ORF type:complete len:116 (-),score=8.65 TRINITY_DN2547_c1_g4_i1:18-365(-)